MKKIDFGQTVTILANIAVIAGIVFLAVELRQNNDLMRAETRLAQLEVRSAYSERILEDVDIGSLYLQSARGEELSTEEFFYFFTFAIDVFTNWEWQFREMEAGLLPEELLPVDEWSGIVRYDPAAPGQSLNETRLWFGGSFQSVLVPERPRNLSG